MDSFKTNKQDYLEIKCDKHNIYNLSYINTDLDKGRAIICPECIADSEIVGNRLVPIIRLFQEDSDDFITKWPTFRQKKLIKKLKTYIDENEIQTNIDEVIKQFDEIKDTIFKQIEQNKKNILTYIQNRKEKLTLILNKLQEIVNVKQFVNCFNQYSNNIPQLNDSLESCIQKVKNTQNEKEDLLMKQIEECCQFDIIGMQNETNKLMDICKKFDYLNLDKLYNITTQNLQVLKTSFQSSDRCSIIKLDNNQIEIENDSLNRAWRQVYVDHVFKQSDKYEIEIQFLDQTNQNQEIFIGLIQKMNINQQGWVDKLSLYTQDLSGGICNVQKGKHFSQIRDKLNVVVFQICLQQKILRCFADANGQRNVVLNDNVKLIKENQDYYFYICMFFNQAKIKILSFEKVNEFRLY